MRFSIVKKFLVAFLFISLAPLVILSYYARETLFQIGRSTIQSSKETLIENAASLLEARARNIARQVELLLKLCEDDLHSLALLSFDSRIYLAFSDGHQRQIWTRMQQTGRLREVRRMVPLYREITYADPEGIERIRILENQIFPGGRHVLLPFRSRFGHEDYFNRAKSIDPADVYVSHLLGRHVRKSEQLMGAESVETAVGGKEYEGIIRFAAPVYRDGAFAGVVSLALDHRHLMEYTQHVLPMGNHEVVFPSYTSGNYAFLFDDEGWIITHPKFWDIRGFDRDTGDLADPLSPEYTEAALQAGRFPFNLLHVPFIHENYRHIAVSVLKGKSGVTTTASVGDVPRVMAYAPIPFDHGEYRKSGYFGGVTLGARTETFYEPVEKTAGQIQDMLHRTVRHFLLIILATALLVAGIAILLARSFSRPIRLLSEKAKEVSAGRFDVTIDIRSGDELASLGRNFQEMGRQLEKQREKLVESLRDLEASQKEAIRERDFIKSVFANVVSGLVVIDDREFITSVNHNTEKILGIPSDEMEGCALTSAFSEYPELLARFRDAFHQPDGAGADFELNVGGFRKYIEVTTSKLKGSQPPTDRSILVVIRDITRRKQMEKYLSRSDRLVSLGTLAAGVAHEIRNPLTGISLMLDDLHDRMSGNSQDQVLIQKSLAEIEKLEKIVTELLEFAANPSKRLISGDINTIIDNTLFLIKKQCNRQHVRLYRNTPDLPPVRIDPEKLKQALLNILLNALNVMPDGGEIHIDTYLQENLEMFTGKPAIEVRICDTGPGVNPADMDYIFDPFFTRTPKGSGLGLSITHTIIEEHKGKILVDSKPGRGACFKIFIPVEEEKNAENTGG